MILYLIGTAVLALGLYWLGAIHGRDYQTKKLGQHVNLAEPIFELMREGATEVISSTRVMDGEWTVVHAPLTEAE